MNATVVPQGKHAELCKQLTKYAAEKDGRVIFPPIKFPCLRVELNAEGNKFAITWSNFYSVKSEHPGKFKLRFIDYRRPLLYVKNHNNRIMKDSRGKPVLDFATMAMQWGTEATLKNGQYTWTYGPNHPYLEETIWEEEFETIDGLVEALSQKFNHEVAEEVCVLFAEHELYQEFDLTYQVRA